MIDSKKARERVEKVRARVASQLVAALDDRDLDAFDRIAGKIPAAIEAPSDDA